MAEARIRLSLSEGTFEIEGSEDFVTKQIEAFGDVIKGALTSPPATMSYPATGVPHGGPKGIDSDPAAYANVFSVAEGVVTILVDLPGESKREKAVSACLLAAYAKSLAGADSLSTDEVRAICKHHACLDDTNFAAHLKSEKFAYTLDGSGKVKTIKLTVPGIKRAKAMADELQASAA